MAYIGDSAFEESGLTSIEIPDSVTEMGTYTFLRCYSLTSVKLGNGMSVTGKNAFSGCISLTDVEFGSGIQAVGEYTFANAGLKNFRLPEGVTEIGTRFTIAAS